GVLSGHHIHQAPSTTTGPIVIDFGNPNTILMGTPMNGTLNGTITGLPAATITSVFNNPTGFYYNLHSTPDYPGGAVRDQIPEPSSVAIFACGTLAFLGYSWRRTRRR
ncbi:MAG TPA: CHRD domain-containing protein, partial [Chthoniobacterales bacterium]|nr:CHRD domain-containing protein [Chthoniobacterales bacterium]